MGIEIEKKYQLTAAQKKQVESRLAEVGATLRGSEFEENILFGGGELDHKKRVLRLRRVGGVALLTYKQRLNSASSFKTRIEEETRVENPEAIITILETTGGYKPALVYEKHRTTWDLPDVEVTLDELPFGSFMEIEGDGDAILRVEELLDLSEVKAEPLSYPELALKYGIRNGDMIETRFGE